MPPTGRPGSMPAKRCTAWRARARIMRLVAVHQRLVEQLGQLLGRERVHRRRPQPWPSPSRAWLLPSSRRAARRARRRRRRWLYSRPAQREVDLEDRLERAPVRVVLHQRGGERVLERLAVLDRDVLHRLHGVEVLGQADTGSPASRSSWMKPSSRSSIGSPAAIGGARCRARAATRAGAPLERLLLGGELLDRLGDVGLVLQQDVGGSRWPARRRRARCRAAPACGPSRSSRTPTAPSSARAGGCERTMRAIWSARCLGDVRAPW